MKHLSYAGLLVLTATLLACGSSDSTGSGGGGQGGEGAQDQGGGGTGGAGTTSGSGGSDFFCGSDVCSDGDVCITRPQEPSCDPKVDPNDPCPPDMPNDTMCGGAGVPCCCGDTPAPSYECSPAMGCSGAPSCDCLTDECPAPMMCSQSEPDFFVCENAPAA